VTVSVFDKSTMPSTLKVTVSDRLYIVGAELPPRFVTAMTQDLTFKNPAKEMAEHEDLWGWRDMPDTIELWEHWAGVWKLPRGYALKLKRLARSMGCEVEWDDHRASRDQVANLGAPIVFAPERDYQESAVLRMLEVQQGIWKAPPGAGKTVAMLEAMRRSGQVSQVVVNKLHIARQWQERCLEYLGVEMGLVGDGVMDVRDYTVVMQQTLWAKRDELRQAGFFEQPGFVGFDECHNLPAPTYTSIANWYTAKYRIGMSGTPGKSDLAMSIVESVLGHVFLETPKEMLRERGILETPAVTVVATPFKHSFWPTHRNDPDNPQGCEFVRFCTRPKSQRLHRNNYDTVVGQLVTHEGRARLVADMIYPRYDAGGCVLVLSKRLAHLELLRDMLTNVRNDSLFDFTGAQSMERRQEIVERAEEGRCVILSTVADEALDIPRLDTLVLAFPTRNTETVKQMVGRIERPHPLKLPPLVIDFRDDVSVLRGQLNDRKIMYRAEGLRVD
jgi:superfamily II DNA or RNA helicase